MKTIIKLDKLGKKIFKQVVDYLKRANKYDEIDQMLIEVYAQAFSDYVKFSEEIRKEGAVVVSDKGNQYTNPNYVILKQSIKTIKDLAKILGIGAYNREKLGIYIDEEDELKEFLEGYDD